MNRHFDTQIKACMSDYRLYTFSALWVQFCICCNRKKPLYFQYNTCYYRQWLNKSPLPGERCKL